MNAVKRTFPTGGTVATEDLVDRGSVLGEMLLRTYQHGNSLMLSSPRQTGKTSIAHELIRQTREVGGLGVYLDCSRTTGDERELAEMIARETYDQISGSRGAFSRLKEFIGSLPKPGFYQSDLDLALMFYGHKEQSPAALLEKALALANEIAQQKDRRCVVIYDEFQTLGKVSSTIFNRIRAVLQHSMNAAAYVFMGSEVGLLDELFKNPANMPFRLATQINLRPPTNEAWKNYLETRFMALRSPLHPGEAEELLHFTGGHPRDLMEACEQLLLVRSTNPRSGAEALTIAKENTLESLRRSFDEVWKRLEAPAGTQVSAARIANRQPLYGPDRARKSVTRTIDALERVGLIRRLGRGEYEFCEPLFGRYIQDLSA